MICRALWLGLLSLAACAGATAAAALQDYRGADAGWLILSVSTDRASFSTLAHPSPITTVSFDLRRAAERSGDRVRVTPSSLFGRKDYSGPLEPATRRRLAELDDPEDTSNRHYTYDTQVLVLRLPPGDYEISSVYLSGMIVNTTYWSRYNRWRLPFHIDAGRALYLGAITPAPRVGKKFGSPAFDYWNLMFDDEHDRDMTIAHRLTPDLGPVDSVWERAATQPSFDAGERDTSQGPIR